MVKKPETKNIDNKKEKGIKKNHSCTCGCDHSHEKIKDCNSNENTVEYETIDLEELQSMLGGSMSHTCTYSVDDLFTMEDLDDRRFYLYDVIEKDYDACDMYGNPCKNQVENIIYHIMRINREDALNEIDVEDRLPILLYISSPGGQIFLGQELIDMISLSKTPVYTINMGMCYSMAYLIFIAGHKRFAMPSSTFLLHDGNDGGYNSAAKFHDRVMFDLEQTEKRIKNHVLEHTNITEEVYDAKYRIEWYSYPEEAKKFGVCDYIVGKDCDLDEIL